MQAKSVKTLTAVVLSNSGSKTVKAVVDYTVKHPKYGKYVKRSTKLAVHDDRSEAAVGDVIEIAQCRPYSKTKQWRLVRVVEKAVRE